MSYIQVTVPDHRLETTNLLDLGQGGLTALPGGHAYSRAAVRNYLFTNLIRIGYACPTDAW
jgi:hypothetical protein